MANYIFEKSFLSIYPRVYETIWELDQYYRTGDPLDQSMSQRIEYTKAARVIIREHPLFGVGTGNFELAYHDAYLKIKTKLDPQHFGTAHNQYLSYLLKFGFIGFAWILFVIIGSVYFKHQQRNHLLLVFLLCMLVGNLGESIFETHVGLSFFVFIFTLLLWHSPQSIENRDTAHQLSE